MTTLEILAAFMKGNEKVSISEKQKSWLLSQAKKEAFVVRNDGFNDTVYLDDCHYKISQCKTLASGGSYVGTRYIQGRYNIEKLYYIQFKSTGLTVVCTSGDMRHYSNEGHEFNVIALKNTYAEKV
jgi:hypothetical protein